jgi:hypothetical protein
MQRLMQLQLSNEQAGQAGVLGVIGFGFPPVMLSESGRW